MLCYKESPAHHLAVGLFLDDKEAVFLAENPESSGDNVNPDRVDTLPGRVAALAARHAHLEGMQAPASSGLM